MKDVEDMPLWSLQGERDILHFLNAQRFHKTSSSLFSLPPPERQQHQGITVPSQYLKSSESFYRVHREQCYFGFFNHCLRGASVCYFVMDGPADRAR